MLSHSLGHRLFSPDPLGKLDFWNLIREKRVIGQGEKQRLHWLVSSSRQKYFGDGEISYRLPAEDLLEYLCRDTFPFQMAI